MYRITRKTIFSIALLFVSLNVDRAIPISDAEPIPKDTKITLERGACFGPCAQYSVTITADGSVTFDGKKNTKVIGTAASTISRPDLQLLLAEFTKIDFFRLKERYSDAACPAVLTDFPSATVSFRSGGKTKTVFHYFGCVTADKHRPFPPGLNLLENKIDEIARTEQWVAKN